MSALKGSNQVLKCDFCGKASDTVTRVAVDKDYDRLSLKHEIKYSCPECFKKKEDERKKQNQAIGKRL